MIQPVKLHVVIPISLILSATLLISFPSYSGTQKPPVGKSKNVDTLLQKQQKKINELLRLSRSNAIKDPEASRKYAEQAEDASMKVNYTKGLADACEILGKNYYADANYPEAVIYLTEAINYCEKLKDNVREALLLQSLGDVYHKYSIDSAALTCYLTSLKLTEEMNDSVRLVGLLSQIGHIYQNKKETTEKAIRILLQALLITENKKTDSLTVDISFRIGELFSEQGEYSKALKYYYFSIFINPRFTSALNNIAVIYHYQGIKAAEKKCYFLSESLQIGRAHV